MIQKQTIDKICTHVAACSNEVLEREFNVFFQDQSEICEFVMDLTSASSQSVRELTLYLSYVTYKVLAEGGGSGKKITSERITEACRESEEWIQNLAELEETEIPSTSLSTMGDEPYLIGFVINEVHDAIEDGLDLREEEKGTVFFVLKTVIRTLTQDSD